MNNTFWMLLKKEATDNHKPILLGLIGIWGLFLLSGIFAGMIADVGLIVEIPCFMILSSFVSTIGASLAFSSMKTKEGRISALMLPASRFEKFFVRWLATVPCLIIVIALGWLFGDLVRIGVERMNNFEGPSFWSLLEQTLGRTGDSKMEWNFFVTICITSFLVTQAFYFFGAILWPRLSFIKTMAALQILQLVLVIFMLVTDLRPFNLNNIDETSDAFQIIIWIISAVLCIGIYWLSYWWYSRSQVVYKLF